jgi:hypothetical protein
VALDRVPHRTAPERAVVRGRTRTSPSQLIASRTRERRRPTH